jgi:hypothetical protein
MFPSERQIKARNAKITKIAFRPHSSKRKQAPAPVTILKGDNLFDVEFRKSGRPTAASERLLDVMGVEIKPKAAPVSNARANLEMMLKGR